MFETWLLSEAPERGNEAISVFQSAQCAESGKTPHVVIISDACRTPARDFDTQRITAVSAFPNRPVGGPLEKNRTFSMPAHREPAKYPYTMPNYNPGAHPEARRADHSGAHGPGQYRQERQMDTCLSRLPGMTFRTFSGLFVGVDKAFSMPWLSLIGVTPTQELPGRAAPGRYPAVQPSSGCRLRSSRRARLRRPGPPMCQLATSAIDMPGGSSGFQLYRVAGPAGVRSNHSTSTFQVAKLKEFGCPNTLRISSYAMPSIVARRPPPTDFSGGIWVCAVFLATIVVRHDAYLPDWLLVRFVDCYKPQ